MGRKRSFEVAFHKIDGYSIRHQIVSWETMPFFSKTQLQTKLLENCKVDAWSVTFLYADR